MSWIQSLDKIDAMILISHQGWALAADRKPREGYYPRSAPGGWESRNGVESYGWDSGRPLSPNPCVQCRPASSSSSSSSSSLSPSPAPQDEYRGNGYDNLSPEWQRRGETSKNWQSGSGSRYDDRRVWQGSIRPIEGGRWDERWEEQRPGGLVTNWMGGPSSSSGDPYRRRDPTYDGGYQQPSWQSDSGYYSGGRTDGYYDRDRGSYGGRDGYGQAGCRTGGCSSNSDGGYSGSSGGYIGGGGGYSGSGSVGGYSGGSGSPPSGPGYTSGVGGSSNGPYGGGYRGGYAGSYGYSDGGTKYNDRGWIPRRPESSAYDYKPSVYYDRSRGESGYLNSCGSSRCQVPKEEGTVSRYDQRWEDNPRWISGVRGSGGSRGDSIDGGIGGGNWGMKNYANGWDYYEQRPGQTYGQGYLYRPSPPSVRNPGESVPWGSEDRGRGPIIGTWSRPSSGGYDRPSSNYPDPIPPRGYRPTYDYQGGGGGSGYSGGYSDDYSGGGQRGGYDYRPPSSERNRGEGYLSDKNPYRPGGGRGEVSYRPPSRPSYYRPDDRPPVDGYNRPTGGGGDYRPQGGGGGYDYERPVGGYRPSGQSGGSSGSYRPSSGGGNFDLSRYPGHTGVGATFDFDTDKNQGNHYYERSTTSTSSTTPRPTHSSTQSTPSAS